jgi:hypothetical protein
MFEHDDAMANRRVDAELTAAVREQLGAGAALDDVATRLVDGHSDIHPVALVKILCDASGEDLETIKSLVHQRLPGPARDRAEAVWEAAEMIWSGKMDIAD